MVFIWDNAVGMITGNDRRKVIERCSLVTGGVLLGRDVWQMWVHCYLYPTPRFPDTSHVTVPYTGLV
jgi:hypothetical protein